MQRIALHRSAIKVIAVVVLPLLASTLPLPSQTKWFKYEGNPVLDVGARGAWDGEGVTPSTVLFRDSLLHMWFSGLDGTYGRLGYATSPDGVRWTKHRSNPVLDINPESWDNGKAYLSHILHTGSQFEMWYTGGIGVNVRIGHATSPDGIVWNKLEDAVLDYDTSRLWHQIGLAAPSVLPPDADGTSRMWFHGIESPGRIQVGVASKTGDLPWTKHPDSVVAIGPPGSWDESRVGYPKVLFNGRIYEMWYSGSKATNNTFRIGYATSRDGVRWTKSPENPVLTVGKSGAWDDDAVWVGDVMLKGMMYHSWYVGFHEQRLRGGLAVSPKGIEVSIRPSHSYVDPHMGIVQFSVRMDDPVGLELFAVMRAPSDGFQPGLIGQGKVPVVDSIKLFDDGQHGDDGANDGHFANSWVPERNRVYIVDLRLSVGRNRAKRFILENAGAFTTVGPIRSEGVEFVGGTKPHPGDTVLVRLRLRNDGAAATPTAVSASLTTADTLVTSIRDFSAGYGVINAGAVATTSGYHRLFISPDCPPETDISLNVSLSTLGVPLWHDTVSIQVVAPWWRTTWAYGLLGVGAVIVMYGLRRLEMKRLQLKHPAHKHFFGKIVRGERLIGYVAFDDFH